MTIILTGSTARTGEEGRSDEGEDKKPGLEGIFFTDGACAGNT